MGQFFCLGASYDLLGKMGDCLVASKEINTFCLFLGREEQWWFGFCTVRFGGSKKEYWPQSLVKPPWGQKYFRIQNFLDFRKVVGHSSNILCNTSSSL